MYNKLKQICNHMTVVHRDISIIIFLNCEWIPIRNSEITVCFPQKYKPTNSKLNVTFFGSEKNSMRTRRIRESKMNYSTSVMYIIIYNWDMHNSMLSSSYLGLFWKKYSMPMKISVALLDCLNVANTTTVIVCGYP